MAPIKGFTLALFAVAFMLSSVACSDSTLTQVAKFEADLNGACAATFQVVAGASTTTPPLISTTDASAIIAVLVQIEQGNRQAQTATAAIAALGPADQSNLIAILTPIQTAANNAVANGTLGIKDPATQQKVQAALVSIQTIINAGISLIKAAKT